MVDFVPTLIAARIQAAFPDSDRRLDEIERRVLERVEAFKAKDARDLGSISGQEGMTFR
jgi:hypothetical protein